MKAVSIFFFFSFSDTQEYHGGYSAAYGGACRALSLQWLYLVEYSCALQASLLSTNLYYIIKHWMQQKCQEIAAAEKSAVYKWKRVQFIFFLLNSQISAAYIRKRFNFESGLDSVKSLYI